MPELGSGPEVPVRYSSVDPASNVFRLVRAGGGHLPIGEPQPKPDWLTPDDRDKDEARKTGRRAGVSFWVRPLASPPQVRAIRGLPPEPDAQPAYEAVVQTLVEVAAAMSTEAVPFALEVVHDPDEVSTGTPGWQGHCLIEGLAAPTTDKAQRRAYDGLRQALIPHFTRCED